MTDPYYELAIQFEIGAKWALEGRALRKLRNHAMAVLVSIDNLVDRQTQVDQAEARSIRRLNRECASK